GVVARAGPRTPRAGADGDPPLPPASRDRNGAQADRDRVGGRERLPRADHLHAGPGRGHGGDQPGARLRTATAVDLDEEATVRHRLDAVKVFCGMEFFDTPGVRW